MLSFCPSGASNSSATCSNEQIYTFHFGFWEFEAVNIFNPVSRYDECYHKV